MKKKGKENEQEDGRMIRKVGATIFSCRVEKNLIKEKKKNVSFRNKSSFQ